MALASFEDPADPRLAISAEVLHGSGAAWPSTLSNSAEIVLSNCGFRSSSKSLTPRKVQNLA